MTFSKYGCVQNAVKAVATVQVVRKIRDGGRKTGSS